MKTRSLQTILVIATTVIGCFVLVKPAHAAYGDLPATLVGQDSQYVNVTNAYDSSNTGFGSYKPNTFVKVYTNSINPGSSRNITVSVHNLNGVNNDCSDYQLYSTIYNTDPISGGFSFASSPSGTQLFFNDNICSIGSPFYRDYNITVQDNWFTPSLREDTKGLYTLVLQITILSGDKRSSFMTLTAPPNTKLGYAAGQDAGVYPRYKTGEDRGGHYILAWKWRASCSNAGGANATSALEWGDDDYPSGNQQTSDTYPFSITLEKINFSGNVISSADLTTRATGTNPNPTAPTNGYYIPNDGPGGTQGWNPKIRYQLKFNNTEGNNGIWVKQPFDSGDFDLQCPEEFDTTGSAGISTDNPENPTQFTATGTIQRNGGETDAPIISAKLSITRRSATTGVTSTVEDGTEHTGFPWAWAGTTVTVPSHTFSEPDGVRSLGWQPGDRICSVLTYRYKKGSVIPGTLDIRRLDQDTNVVNSNTCVFVTNKPYVSIYDNDVSAGGGGLGQPCSGTGNITTYSKDGGSGTQLAAYANGTIGSSFKTAFLRSVTPITGDPTFPVLGMPVLPDGLKFASYGRVDCATDFYTVDQFEDGDARKDPHNGATLNLGAPGLIQNGEQTVSTPPQPLGKLTLDGTISFNVKHSVFVDGDVHIRNNIEYGSTTWDNIDAIPYFNLVVKGNIYIDPGVTRLDGRYIAQPKADGSKGEIFTCAPGGNNPGENGNTLWNSCGGTSGRRLTINGQFVAKQVHFLRTVDTISSGTYKERRNQSKASEIFNFSPELYLARPAVRPTATSTSGEYEYITTLPPIL